MRDSCVASSVARPVHFFSVHSVFKTGHSYAAGIIVLRTKNEPFEFKFSCLVLPFIVEYFPDDFVCDSNLEKSNTKNPFNTCTRFICMHFHLLWLNICGTRSKTLLNNSMGTFKLVRFM